MSPLPGVFSKGLLSRHKKARAYLGKGQQTFQILCLLVTWELGYNTTILTAAPNCRLISIKLNTTVLWLFVFQIEENIKEIGKYTGHWQSLFPKCSQKLSSSVSLTLPHNTNIDLSRNISCCEQYFKCSPNYGIRLYRNSKNIGGKKEKMFTTIFKFLLLPLCFHKASSSGWIVW